MYSLAKFDPRVKFMLLICLSTGALVVENVWFLAGLLIFTSLIMALGGISLKDQWSQGKIAVSMVIFLFIIQMLFVRTGEALIEIRDFTLVTFDGLHMAAYLSIRLLIIILSALIILTGDSRDYLLAMTQCRMPYEIAFMTMVGFHFFPMLKEEALDIFYSVQLRGTELKKTSLRRKLQTYLKISLPILASALDKAKAMAAAMEARCFRIYPYRTYMRRLKLNKKDIAALVILPLLTAGFIFFGLSTEVSAATKATSADFPVEKQVMLSWSGDISGTQTVMWKGSKSQKEQYVSYKKAGDPDEAFKKVKATVKSIRDWQYYRCRATIEGLAPDTKYIYYINNDRSRQAEFTTAPKATEEFSFMYLGDIQYDLRDEDYAAWGKMTQTAYKENPEIAFSLIGGDMIDKTFDMRDWDAFFEAAQPVFSKIPLMTVPGNHETSIVPSVYLDMFGMPKSDIKSAEEEFYSFDYGNAHFVGLNTCFLMDERRTGMGDAKWDSKLKEINEWLQKDLSQSKKTWKIVFMHHPPYGVEENDAVYSRVRENWVPVFEKNGVQLAFMGDQHVYLRTKSINGVTYVMGNSGNKKSMYVQDDNIPDYIEEMNTEDSNYQIIKIDGDELSLDSYSENGDTIDSFTEDADGTQGSGNSAVIVITVSAVVAAAVLILLVIFLKRRRKTSIDE